MTVHRERVQLLVEALESGEFKQGTGALHHTIRIDEDTEEERYCCLGVACIVAQRAGAIEFLPWTIEAFQAYRGEGALNYGDSILTDELVEWFGFDTRDPFIMIEGEGDDEMHVTASTANDSMGLNFVEIAAKFREFYLSDEPAPADAQ